MIYNVVLVSTVQQSESAIGILKLKKTWKAQSKETMMVTDRQARCFGSGPRSWTELCPHIIHRLKF